MGIFPVQQLELFGGLQLLSENIPSRPADFANSFCRLVWANGQVHSYQAPDSYCGCLYGVGPGLFWDRWWHTLE